MHILNLPSWLNNNFGILSASHVYKISDFKELANFCNKMNIKKLAEVPIIDKLIDEVSEFALIEKEIDAAEYLYDVKKLINLKGRSFSDQRYRINHFNKLYPGADFSYSHNLPSQKVAGGIKEIYEIWHDFSTQSSMDISHEEEALERYLSIGKLTNPKILNNTMNFYLNYQGKLIGYAMVEIVKDSYAVGHFLKLNLNISGSTVYFIHKICEVLDQMGVKYLNAQEDMGVEGLREFKQKLRPDKMCYAYTVVFG